MARDEDLTSPDEREEAQLIPKDAATRDAIALLHRTSRAVLCTISKRVEGFPFASVAPFALDRRGEPILLIASIAEHTKNVLADDRVSLLVQERVDSGEDAQAHGRITLMGRAAPIPSDAVEDARARYVARVPGAAGYFGTHDFRLFGIAVEHVRFIGGFGRIFWLEPERLRLDPATDPLASGGKGIVDHMNADHADALSLYCRAFKGVQPESAQMVGVDQYGFDVITRGPDGRQRFDFEVPQTMATVRGAVVEMVKKARTQLGESKKS